MAEDLNHRSVGSDSLPAPLGLDRREEPETIVRPPPPDWQPGPHAGRFLLAYGLLGVVLGATVVALAVVITRSDGPKPVAWSSWKPSDTGSKGVREIVAHVSPRYRMSDGRQLVIVFPRPPTEDPAIVAAAINKQALFDKEQQFSTFVLDKSLFFVFCGDGTNCAMAEQPTEERHRLMRQEALELALYSFRYMDGVDSVVTFLPARIDATAGDDQEAVLSALFFRKSQYQTFTKTPLAQTLPGIPDETNQSKAQSDLVDRLTLPAFYRYTLQRTPDGGGSILVLNPAVTG